MTKAITDIRKEVEVGDIIKASGVNLFLELGVACLALDNKHSKETCNKIFNKIEEAELQIIKFLKKKKNKDSAASDLIFFYEYGTDLRAIYPIAIVGSLWLYNSQSIAISKLCRLCASASSRESKISTKDILLWRWIIMNHCVDSTFVYNDNGSVSMSGGSLMLLKGGKALMGDVSSESDISRLIEERNLAYNIPETITVSDTDQVAFFVKNLPKYTPQELFTEIEKRGYIGQDNARKRLCLAICNHISRLRRIYLDKVKPSTIPRPNPTLISGATGSGKTYLIKLLCEITGLPFAVIDTTEFSETGYYGKNLNEALFPLVTAANDNIEWAENGIIVFDEIDKITQTDTRTMVSRDGVQRSLLKMIEGTKISVKKRFGYDNFNSTKIFDTTNTFFIGLGVFPEFNKPANDKPSIGFQTDQINDRLNAKKSEQLGFSGELFGRFTGGLLQLDPLTKPELETILKQGVVSEYSNRLEYEGFKLEIEDECYSLLATQALDLGTNARGLQSSFSNVLQEAEYELKSSIAATNIRLFLDNNDIKYELKTCFPDNLFCNQTKSCG